MANGKPKNDFDADNLVAQSNKHEEDISDIKSRVGSNEDFARTFKVASETCKEIDEPIRRILIDLIQSNPEVETELAVAVNKIDRVSRDKVMKVFGNVIGAIILAIISGSIGVVIGAFIS